MPQAVHLRGSPKNPIFIATPTWSNAIANERYPVRNHRTDGFPFTDLSSIKRRPALVISTDNTRRLDIIVAYITSISRNQPDAAPMEPTLGNGLKVSSLVRFDKVATIDKSIIVGRLGAADPIWLKQTRNVFFAVFGFDPIGL